MKTTIFLKKLPQGAPKESDFGFVQEPISNIKLQDGDILLQPLFMSVDPYMRGRLPVFFNKPMVSNVVAKVVASKADKFAIGDLYHGQLPWSTHIVVNKKKQRYLMKIPRSLGGIDISSISASHFLGALGLTGQTAYYGLLDVGCLKNGENVFVSGAAGATGSMVGQIARMKGCRVVGTAGNATKIDWLKDDLKFDEALNYKKFSTVKDAQVALKKAFPNGIDVYFDNTGGLITEAVWDLLNKRARVVVCGQIANYNKFNSVNSLITGDTGIKVNDFLFKTIYKSVRIEGFVVTDCKKWGPFYKDMGTWIRDRRIVMRETVTHGFMNAHRAFIGMLSGTNIGKMVVECDDVEPYRGYNSKL